MENRIINYTLLWERLRDYATKVGRLSVRPLLLLYYLVLPIDILDVKKLPVIGWFDEIASAAIAYKKVCKHITPAMEAEVDAILDRWFPGYTPYELISDEV